MARRSVKRAYAIARGDFQTARVGAFVDGLRRHGWDCVICPAAPASNGAPAEYDLLIMWGVRRRAAIARQKADGGEVCVLECGYLGDREREWVSASLGGGLNGRGRFPAAGDDGARFFRHFGHMLRPWRERDGYALIMGQVPGDMALEPVGGCLSRWYDAAAKAFGPCARFRPHPKAPRREGPRGVPVMGGSLDEALAGARVAVTFNSNAGVDAALAGVPVIATDEGSMARRVAAHGFDDDLITPDRGEWLARLAWCQWTVDEMRAGDAWDALREAS